MNKLKEEIDGTRTKINTRYIMTQEELCGIIDLTSEDGFGLTVNAFLLGYSRGRKAGLKEERDNQLAALKLSRMY
jgi:hypothetical protein